MIYLLTPHPSGYFPYVPQSLTKQTLKCHNPTFCPLCCVVGVLVLSWYPPGVADDHGEPTEDLVPAVMDAAHRHSIKVTGETTGMFFLSDDLLNK